MAQVKARLELQHSDAQFGKKRGTRGAKDGVNPSAGRRFTWAAQKRRICFKTQGLGGGALEYLPPKSRPQEHFDHRDSLTLPLLVTDQPNLRPQINGHQITGCT